MTRWSAAVAVLLATTCPARADTPPDRDVDLALHSLPPAPVGLRMRVAQTDGDPPDDTAPPDEETLDPEGGDAPDARPLRDDDDERDLLVPRTERTLEENVIFRFNLGWGLDGGQPTEERRLLSGAQLDTDNYSSLRIYSFGDAVIGSRGLGTASLSTYLAAHFYFDQDGGRPSQAVPTVYDNDRVGNLQVRTAYAETDGMFDNRWLKPLFVRAGRQYRYGPAIAHFDGLTLGFDTRAFSVTTFGGTRVPLFPLVLEDRDGNKIFDDPRDTLSGWDARINLWEIKRVPLVLTGSLLRFRKTTHFEGGLVIRWSPDILIRSSVRILGNDLARESLNVRARISDTTTINAIFENRSGDDWIYDLLFTETATDASDPRQYLNLGLPLPRFYAGLRGGTVFVDNIDVTFRGGVAVEHDDTGDSTFSSSYWEAGGAAEVRIRRTLSVGASGLARRYRRDELDAMDVTELPDPLALSTARYGEKGFVEMGGTLRFSEGARKFSAGAEIYSRTYRFPRPDLPEIDGEIDVVVGGRFSVEGWAGERLRLKAEYDLSGQIRRSPELRGLKSLRVLAEGRF